MVTYTHKNIYEVKDIQQCQFNHVRYKDVADTAKSVHLMLLMDQMPERKGGSGHITTAPSSASNVCMTSLSEMLTDP